MGLIQQPLPAQPDIADRAGRLLGHVSVDSLPALPAGTSVIGHVVVDSGAVSVSGTADVTDRVARQVGQVQDIYTAGECSADVVGDNLVHTVSFAKARNLIVVESVGGVSRVDPFGGTPSASAGIRCDDGVPTYIPVQATSVKVYVPTGATVSVWAASYS